MDALLGFAAALVALRLAGGLLRRYRESRRPELAVWAGALAAYALAAAALAWGSAHGWDARAFRVYYLFGGLETAPLLGCGSLLLAGRRFALPLALVYAGLAAGVAIAMPMHGHFGGTAIPVTVGANVTSISQAAPGSSGAVHVFVCAKSAGCTPVIVMLAIVNGTVPLLLTVIGTGAVVAPTACVPKSTDPGVAVSAGKFAATAVFMSV